MKMVLDCRPGKRMDSGPARCRSYSLGGDHTIFILRCGAFRHGSWYYLSLSMPYSATVVKPPFFRLPAFLPVRLFHPWVIEEFRPRPFQHD